MCGIAGIVQWSHKVDAATLERMGGSLSHRGPDGAGVKLLADDHVGLAHRRLSILDLSDAGAQPMSDTAGEVWISFNGMISNFQTLRAELEMLGYCFRSHTDTEVIVAAYRAWGRGSFARLRGMFAFALWDNRNRCLTLVRDQFGIKPLYLWRGAGGIAFGSEIKALLAAGVTRRTPRTTALRDFLFYRYVPFGDTAFDDVEKLPPASWLSLTFDRMDTAPKVETGHYWQPTVGREKYDPAWFDAQVTEILSRSVANNMVSDVPMGIFLSGGYDSATIADLATRGGRAVSTYTIRFEGWDRSEHEQAAETAARLGTCHHQRMLGAEQVDIFAEGAACYDDPFGGTSFWPTKRLAALARPDITVALGGDGGDEIFGGYNWYAPDAPDMASMMEPYIRAMNWGGMTGAEVAAVLNLPTADHTEIGDIFRAALQPSVGGVKAFQLLDLQTFLPDVVLAKIDRAAMAHALEMRVPFLDPDLIDLVFSADESLYLQPGVKKPILQRIVAPRLGDMLANRPKQGFSAPVYNYIPPADLFAAVMGGAAVRDGILNKNMVEQFGVAGRYQPLFALRVLDAWYTRWVGD